MLTEFVELEIVYYVISSLLYLLPAFFLNFRCLSKGFMLGALVIAQLFVMALVLRIPEYSFLPQSAFTVGMVQGIIFRGRKVWSQNKLEESRATVTSPKFFNPSVAAQQPSQEVNDVYHHLVFLVIGGLFVGTGFRTATTIEGYQFNPLVPLFLPVFFLLFKQYDNYNNSLARNTLVAGLFWVLTAIFLDFDIVAKNVVHGAERELDTYGALCFSLLTYCLLAWKFDAPKLSQLIEQKQIHNKLLSAAFMVFVGAVVWLQNKGMLYMSVLMALLLASLIYLLIAAKYFRTAVDASDKDS